VRRKLCTYIVSKVTKLYFMTLDYLQPLMAQSVVKETPRGTRRYFPIQAKQKRGWKWLYQAFFIIYGREAKDNAQVGYAILESITNLHRAICNSVSVM